MTATSLGDFVSSALEHKRIRFGDLRRLQRDILPARITSREQAEVLIALDSSVDKADREWRRYLIATTRDFTIWGSPPGRIDQGKAEWLFSALRTSARKTAGAITREIIREAPEVDDNALQVLSMNPRRGRSDSSSPVMPPWAKTWAKTSRQKSRDHTIKDVPATARTYPGPHQAIEDPKGADAASRLPVQPKCCTNQSQSCAPLRVLPWTDRSRGQLP